MMLKERQLGLLYEIRKAEKEIKHKEGYLEGLKMGLNELNELEAAGIEEKAILGALLEDFQKRYQYCEKWGESCELEKKERAQGALQTWAEVIMTIKKAIKGGTDHANN